MEKKLKMLFDYQRFEENSALAALIRETESRAVRELTDNELSMVYAAGDQTAAMNKPELKR